MKYLRLALQMSVAIAAQILVFNSLRILPYFTPIIYLYPLFKRPIGEARWILILAAAVAGFVVDAFMNTPGLNLAAAAFTAYLRTPLLDLLGANDLEEEQRQLGPSFATLKRASYLLLVILFLLVHISSLLLLEVFSTTLFTSFLPYIGGSLLSSTLIFLVLDAFRKA